MAMDFFDDAVNKAKDVFEVAKKKTSEVVSTEKRRLDISMLRSKMDKDLIRLGRIYFEKIKNDELGEGEEKSICDSIKVKSAEIARLTRDIEDIKNDNKCSACGATVAAGSSFCSVCGAKID